MESIGNLIGQLFGAASNIFEQIAVAASNYRVGITIFMFVLVIFYRIAMANFLYVRRHDKKDWFIWGALLILQIITVFIKPPSIWLFAELFLFVAMIGYALLMDKTRQLKTTVYSNNLVYEDTSDKYEDKEKNEKKEKTRMHDGKISRYFSASRMHMILGVPVFMNKFVFRISTTSTQEQISKMVKQLSDYYNEYNWRKLRSKRGIKYEVTAEVKISKNLIVPFDKEISDALPWYIIPTGAIDVSNKATAKATPYVWMIHDPKTEGKTFPVLAKTQTFPAAPQAFVVGSTGGGKSVLLNTMIAHLVNKGKQEHQAELYLVDPKRVEFRCYESLKEVEQVAVTLDEALELTNKFREKMLDRNEMMEKEGIKNIPLDGKVSLKRHIDINGKLFFGNEVVEFKTTDGQIVKDYALNLKDRTDIAEVNMPDPEPEEKEEDNGGFGW